MTGSSQPNPPPPADLPPGERAHNAHWIGGRVRTSAGLRNLEDTKIACPCRVSNLGSSSPYQSLNRLQASNVWMTMMNCERFGSDCHMRLCVTCGNTKLCYYAWFPDTLNTCNKTLHRDNWSKWATCHGSSRVLYRGNQTAVQYSTL